MLALKYVKYNVSGKDILQLEKQKWNKEQRKKLDKNWVEWDKQTSKQTKG